MYGSNLPDTGGLFLRGHGEQWHLQNNGSIIGDTWTLHQSGALGQRQGDGIRNIEGGWTSKPPDGAAGPYSWGAVTNLYDYFGTGAQTGWGRSEEHHWLDASRVVPTANENRPVNMAVRYLVCAAR
jgi:hypothetical protein